MSCQIVVNQDGSIEFIKDAASPMNGLASQVARINTVRASNVMPYSSLKRVAFILIRTLFGDRGVVADWTRRWKGPHIAEMVDGVTLGPFPSREVALEREVKYLLATRF